MDLEVKKKIVELAQKNISEKELAYDFMHYSDRNIRKILKNCINYSLMIKKYKLNAVFLSYDDKKTRDMVIEKYFSGIPSNYYHFRTNHIASNKFSEEKEMNEREVELIGRLMETDSFVKSSELGYLVNYILPLRNQGVKIVSKPGPAGGYALGQPIEPFVNWVNNWRTSVGIFEPYKL